MNSVDHAGLEEALIAACARTRLSSSEIDHIRGTASRNVDWRRLSALAEGHSIEPLVFRSLRAACPDLVPKGLLKGLKINYEANKIRNQFLAAELAKIVRALQEAGIAAIAYKGPVMGEMLYEDAAAREFGDLDLIVRAGDVLQARRLLITLGYRSQFDFSEEEERLYIQSRIGYCYSLERQDQAGTALSYVELHWRTEVSDTVPPDWLWKQTEPADVNGIAVLRFRVEALMLLLCLHGFRHFWGSLKWLADVSELLRAFPELNWPVLLNEAVLQRRSRMLFLGLLLAHEVLGAPVPAELLKRMRSERAVVNTARAVRERLFRLERLPVGFVNNLRMRDGAIDRAAYVRDMILYAFTPHAHDRTACPLPHRLRFLYYAIRPIRIAAVYAPRYGKLLLRRFGRRR